MKFAQLKAGQAFVWRGRQYLKVTPLMAIAEDSEDQQLIPRSAEVTPAGAAATDAPPEPGSIGMEQALRELARLEQRLHAELDSLRALPPGEAGDLLRSLLNDCRRRLLRET